MLLCVPAGYFSDFYPRPPRGGRQAPPSKNGQTGGYFYPRPPRGGRRCAAWAEFERLPISIHALREEGDVRDKVSRCSFPKISIHALREEGDKP